MRGILHINSYGVFNTLFQNLYEEQKCMGLSICVYEFAAKGTENRAVSIPETLSGAIIRDYNHACWMRYFYSLKHRIVYWACRERICSFDEVDLIHAHSLFSNGYIAYKIKKEFGIPYIVTVRNTDINDFFKKLFFMIPFGNKLLNEASRIVFLSPSYRDVVIQNYVPQKSRIELTKKTVVIPNGINQYWHEHINENIVPLLGKHLRVLTVGSINRNKNQTAVAEALHQLSQEGYTIEYKIIGKVEDDTVRKKLTKLSFVEILDSKPKEELIKYYRNSNIFILVSLSESFGLVYPEALSQSLPVIYTEKQGFDQQFEEGYVGYSSQTDPDSIAAAIHKLLDRYDDIVQNCAAASKRFSWKQISKEYDKVYDDEIN